MAHLSISQVFLVLMSKLAVSLRANFSSLSSFISFTSSFSLVAAYYVISPSSLSLLRQEDKGDPKAAALLCQRVRQRGATPTRSGEVGSGPWPRCKARHFSAEEDARSRGWRRRAANLAADAPRRCVAFHCFRSTR